MSSARWRRRSTPRSRRCGDSGRCGEEHFESFSREGMSVEGEQPVPLNLANRNCLPPRGALMTKSSRLPVIGILLIGVICPSARVSAQQRPAIADQIAKTYGLDSWDQVEAIRYTFNLD